MNALAVSLYVTGRPCLVVGEGAIADERRARLIHAGAEVALVSPADYQADACRGAFLVFCCEPGLAAQVTRDARAHGALAYAMDNPSLSDFAMPALVRRGALSLAISTEGRAPALARRIREELERLFQAEGLEELVVEMARLRQIVQKSALVEVARRLHIEGRLFIDTAP